MRLKVRVNKISLPPIKNRTTFLPPINRKSIEKQILKNSFQHLVEDTKEKLEQDRVSHVSEYNDYKDKYTNAKRWKDLESDESHRNYTPKVGKNKVLPEKSKTQESMMAKFNTKEERQKTLGT